jgi:hypothetical protein
MLKVGSILINNNKFWINNEVLLVTSVGYSHEEYCENHQDLGYHCTVIIGIEPRTRWFSCRYINDVGLESWIII